MKLKLNEITSSLTKEDVVKNMVKRYQGIEVEGNQQALDYTIASREHAIKKIESEFMSTCKDGKSFSFGKLEGSYQTEVDSIPVLISTPFYYSFKSAPAFKSANAEDSNLYMRAQLAMLSTRSTSIMVAQWSPHQSLIENVVYDADYVDHVAIPYLESIVDMYEQQKDTPVYIVRDDLINIVERIKEYDAQIEILNDLRKELLEQLQEESGGSNLKIGDSEYKLVERKGSIDYAKYAKENNLDLESYRRNGSSYWRLI